jgi:hypothetical protein
MAITISAYTGSTSISTTEHSMTTDTSGPDTCTTTGIFQAFVDLNAMTGADEFKLAIYETVLASGGTQRKLVEVTFTGVQSPPLVVTPALTLGVGWDMTLIKVSGTDRSLPWRIAQVA